MNKINRKGFVKIIEKLALFFSLLNNHRAPVFDLMCDETSQMVSFGSNVHNVRLFLGIIKCRTNSIINRMNYSDQPSKILAKRDRVPKFNIDEAPENRNEA